MIISGVTAQRTGGETRFAAQIRTAADPTRVREAFITIHRSVEAPETLGDSFLAAGLLPAMYLGEPLEIHAPVSGRLVQAINTVQDIFACWYPQFMRRVAVATPAVIPEGTRRTSEATACFFSGGMDSRYSMVKHCDTISALLTVKGFDIPIDDTNIWPKLAAVNRETAADFGMDFIAVETNLREVVDPTYPAGDFWGHCLHGPLLAAVGLCFQRQFGTVIIPSTWPYHRLVPWGSHPLVDGQWSTAATNFLHDGCEYGRLDKLRVIARTPQAIRNLRTCFDCTYGEFNCGRCDKCFRTKLMLQLYGVFDEAGSYGQPLPLESLITREVTGFRRMLYHDLLREAEVRGNAEMVHHLKIALGERHSYRRDWHLLKTGSARVGSWIVARLGVYRHARSVRKRWRRLRAIWS